jgi:aryl-alcohol dehydrogenase-like predicted oxidoreductase
MMEYTTLGTTGIRVSRLGFGCSAIGGHEYGPVDDRTSERAIHRALELGVTFFDVADVYGLGHAETVLGRALRGRTHDAVVATKVGVRFDAMGSKGKDLSAAWMDEALRGSLRRLDVERITLYQIHWPDPDIPIEHAMERMLMYQRSGAIQHIGLCNVDHSLAERARSIAPVESLQIPLSVAERRNRELAHLAGCAWHMTVQTYNVLARGLFGGRYSANSTFSGDDTRPRSVHFSAERVGQALDLLERLRSVGERHRCGPAGVAVRWVLDQPGVGIALTGIKNPTQAEENVSAIDVTLDADDLALLEESAPIDATV